MLESPENFKYGFQRKNFEDWAISRQLLTRFQVYKKVMVVELNYDF